MDSKGSLSVEKCSPSTTMPEFLDNFFFEKLQATNRTSNCAFLISLGYSSNAQMPKFPNSQNFSRISNNNNNNNQLYLKRVNT